MDAPDTVQSLILLEPALKVIKSANERTAAMTAVVDHYQKGDKAAAIDAFMRAVAGEYRNDLERVLPGAFEQAVHDADTFLGQEWPAVQQWSFTPEHAKKVTQPTLAVIGEKNLNVSVWKERQEMLVNWLPNVEPFVLSGATHLLHLQNPDGMAEAIANFCKHHPISNVTSLY
jgi:pimeloyl-ACP methyl ester carboxylesterase